MRRSVVLLIIVLLVVPTLFAGVNRSGGKFYFIKAYGQHWDLFYGGNLRNGQQLIVQMNYAQPAMFFHSTRGELVVGTPGAEKCVVLEANARGTDRVILWDCSGNAQWNEQWQLIPATGQIKHVNHGGCLENRNGKTVIAACNGKNNQRWNWQFARSSSYGR